MNMKKWAAALTACALVVPGAAMAERNASGSIVALAFDAASSALLEANAESLYRSSDGGGHWVRLALPPRIAKGGRIAAMAVSAKGNAHLYLAGPGLGFLRSDDGGRSWIAPGKGIPEGKIVALAAHANQADTVYAVLAGRGIFRSEDAGATWRLMDKGPRKAIVQLVHSDMPGSMQTGWLFGVTAKGIVRAMDCFCGWRDAGKISAKVSAVSYDPTQPRRMYAATSEDLFVSVNGGEQWTKLISPAVNISALATAPTGALYAATRNGALYRTGDQGKTWERVDD